MTELDGEERAWCPICGMAHEFVRPGKTQPSCDCDTICPACGEKTIKYHTEDEVKDSEYPNVSGYFCSKCGPFPEEERQGV